MIGEKALVAVGALGTLGFVGAVGVASTMPLMMMFAFACRRCGVSGRLSREEYKGVCPNCGNSLKVRDVKRVRVRVQQKTTATAGATTAMVNEDPLAILKLRLAKGEISIGQYNELKGALTK